MERRAEGRQARREFWTGHVEEWKRGGLSQVGYCRKHRISIKSFAYWKRKLTSSEPSTSLVEVPRLKVSEVFVRPRPLCLRIGDRYAIDIDRDFDTETLVRLLRIMENR